MKTNRISDLQWLGTKFNPGMIGDKTIRRFKPNYDPSATVVIGADMGKTSRRLGIRVEELPQIGITPESIDLHLLVKKFVKDEKGLFEYVKWRKDEPQNSDTLCDIVVGMQRTSRFLEFDQETFNESIVALTNQRFEELFKKTKALIIV